MELEPLVTVVIPTYNGADYLDAAIRSVLDQTYKRIELIVLDDGSTDHTSSVLKRYEGMFTCERHDNMGQANTLNKGWAMSKGELLSYLSADDVLLPHAVEEAVRCLNRHPSIVLAYCDYNLIDERSRHIRKVNTPEFSYYDMAVKLLCQPGPGVFFRREAFERCEGWSGRYRQMPDFEFWLRMGLLGDFLRIPVVCSLYRIHDRSQTFANLDEVRANEPVDIMTAYFEHQRQIPEPIKSKQHKAMSNAFLLSSRLHLKSHRFKKGLRMLAKAVRLYPANLFAFRTVRLLANALINRPMHAAVRKLRNKLTS